MGIFDFLKSGAGTDENAPRKEGNRPSGRDKTQILFITKKIITLRILTTLTSNQIYVKFS